MGAGGRKGAKGNVSSEQNKREIITLTNTQPKSRRRRSTVNTCPDDNKQACAGSPEGRTDFWPEPSASVSAGGGSEGNANCDTSDDSSQVQGAGSWELVTNCASSNGNSMVKSQQNQI